MFHTKYAQLHGPTFHCLLNPRPHGTQPPLSATPPTTHTSTTAKSKWVTLNAALFRCNSEFYCSSYSLLNMFRAPLCPSSGAQEYYTVVAACVIQGRPITTLHLTSLHFTSLHFTVHLDDFRHTSIPFASSHLQLLS